MLCKAAITVARDDNSLIYTTEHEVDNSISIHGAVFALNLPLEMVKTLILDLQSKVLFLERLNGARKEVE